AGANLDRIVDFSVADDIIHLANDIFGALVAEGALSADYFRVGAAADNNDYITYDSASGALSYDADGSGAGAAIAFAQLTAGLALTNADFWVV
ncbi:MAG TPA: hypothetical protein VEC06_12515, partial [Paucimonas sp.]|nr:hypothetical protein [Paucimonas sp.]